MKHFLASVYAVAIVFLAFAWGTPGLSDAAGRQAGTACADELLFSFGEGDRQAPLPGVTRETNHNFLPREVNTGARHRHGILNYGTNTVPAGEPAASGYAEDSWLIPVRLVGPAIIYPFHDFL